MKKGGFDFWPFGKKEEKSNATIPQPLTGPESDNAPSNDINAKNITNEQGSVNEEKKPDETPGSVSNDNEGMTPEDCQKLKNEIEGLQKVIDEKKKELKDNKCPNGGVFGLGFLGLGGSRKRKNKKCKNKTKSKKCKKCKK